MEQPEKEILTHKLTTRNLQISDYDDVEKIMQIAYARMGGAWDRGEFTTLLSLFPEDRRHESLGPADPRSRQPALLLFWPPHECA